MVRAPFSAGADWMVWRVTLGAAPPGKARHNLAAIDNLLERSAANFPEHRALLANIPPRPTEASLQLYLW